MQQYQHSHFNTCFLLGRRNGPVDAGELPHVPDKVSEEASQKTQHKRRLGVSEQQTLANFLDLPEVTE